MSELVQASELVRTLMDPSPSEVFVLKRWDDASGTFKDFRVRVRLLRIEQMHEALAAAQRYAQERGELKDYGDIYREAQGVEVVLRALCRPDPHDANGRKMFLPMFVDAKQLRSSFDEPEMAQVLNMYEIVKAKYGAIEDMDDSQLEFYLERLADGMQGAYFLAHLDSKQWPRLIFSLAHLALSYRNSLSQITGDSLSSSESEPATSESGTTDFSTLPDARLEGSETQLPLDKLLTPEDARALVKKPEDSL